ncbi:MAG: hypothetical protein GX444_00525 [Myxococcales bacterium]|nr:hypothetical protein [Myxococcales bacterium]
MRRFGWLLVWLFLLGLAACDVDQDDPYRDQEGVEIDFPSLDPNRYHWDGFSNPYYEGWFFRVLAAPDTTFAFIYGVQNPGVPDADSSSSYVVVARNGEPAATTLYPVDAFDASRQRLAVRVGDNVATADGLAGSLTDDGEDIRWNLRFTIEDYWAETMGLLTNIPGLPVNWYVGMLRGRADGEIIWKGESFAVEGAPIYSDKNWGTVFPTSYIWIQAGGTSPEQDALAFAGGDIGVMAGMFIWRGAGRNYEMRSQDLNTLVDIWAAADQGRVRIDLRQGDTRLVLDGAFGDDEPVLLPAPTDEGYAPYTRMALLGELQIEVYARTGWDYRLLETVRPDQAAVEIGGAYWGE